MLMSQRRCPSWLGELVTRDSEIAVRTIVHCTPTTVRRKEHMGQIGGEAGRSPNSIEDEG